jgi:CubicO group peptidase (beta-lactamase class C family)
VLVAVGLMGEWGGAVATELPPVAPAAVHMDPARLALIDDVVARGIRRGDYPGAVIVIGRHGRVAFQRAYGDRTLVPRREPMRLDALFDIASLTKVVVTAPAIMQLNEAGRLSLDERLGDLIPACNVADRRDIRVRQLLAHESGLRGVFTERTLRRIGSYQDAVAMACAETMSGRPGAQLRYSDLNYVLLGDIVRRVSGEELDQYAYRHILRPLGMQETYFNPPAALHARLVGEDVVTGQVENGVATRMGGVAGHSGLYSTAADLAVFSAMLLNGGVWQGGRILSEASVTRMTTAMVRHARGTRGYGFDIATGFSGSRGGLFPCDSFGHTGYSGVSMWLDRRSDTFVIVLTNRLHPAGKGDVKLLREEVATIAAGSLQDVHYARAADAPLNPAHRCRAGRG